MKKLLILFIALSSFVQSQNDDQNHRKYWYYKSRLNNDFVKVGTGRGESMPFNQRGVYTKYLFGGNYQLEKAMKLGDGTSTLGHYIGVLATEYYLLKANGQNTDSVKHELFCALTAFNRCDALAEGYSSANINSPTGLNGFFIRDDIPKFFVLNNYRHFNYYNTWDGVIGGNQWNVIDYDPATLNNDMGFTSLNVKGMSREESNWSDFETKINLGNQSQSDVWSNLDNGNGSAKYQTTFVSQDQVYNMLFGLALVSKFVDGNATDNGAIFPYEGQGVSSIQQEARNIADRIIQHIRNDNFWRIEYPGTNQNVFGGNAGSYSYAIAESGCFISGNSNLPLVSTSLNPLHVPQGCNQGFGNGPGGYQNFYSESTFITWNQLAEIPGFKMDLAGFLASLSAVCNCIYDKPVELISTSLQQVWQQIPVLNWIGWIIDKVWNLVTIVVNALLGFVKTNVTSTDINSNAYFWDLDHAPLARKVLHGGVFTPNWKHSFDYLLDVAPCEGTYNFGNGNYGHYEWSADNRLDHSKDRIGTDPFYDDPNQQGNQQWPSGEFNGIDYMLYHNLWYIHKYQQNGNQGIQDLSDRYINLNGGILGQSGPVPIYQFYIHAFETIVAEKTIVPATTAGEFRAGKTIHFKPGMQISGSNVHVFIDPFSCRSGSSYQRFAYDTAKATDNNFVYPTQNFHEQEYEQEPIAIKYNENNNNEVVTENEIIEHPLSLEEKVEMINSFKDLKIDIVLTPNPTNGVCKALFYLNEKEFANIYIMDMKGNVVKEYTNIIEPKEGVEIDLSNAPVGTYLVKFITSDGREKVQKVIKTYF